jgi:hypothetical protein
MQKQKRYPAKVFLAVSSVFALAIANVQTVFGQGQGQGWNKSNYDMTGLPHPTLLQIVTNVASWLLMIFGFIAIIGFVISGIIYLISAGDEDAQERAKRAMIYSITGVLTGLAGLVVLYAVSNLLGATSM